MVSLTVRYLFRLRPDCLQVGSERNADAYYTYHLSINQEDDWKLIS